MDAYSKDLLRGVGGGGDGEKKVQRLESRTEEVDLSLGLSLGGRFGADRRSGEGLAGSSSATPQGSGFPLSGVVVEPSALLRATLQGSGFLGSAAEVQPSATMQGSAFPLKSIKEEPAAELRGEGILKSTSSLPVGIEGGLRKRKPENLKWLEAERRIKRMKSSKVSAGEPKMRQLALKGKELLGMKGWSLSSAVVPWSEGTNGIMGTASSSASAMIAAALGSGGEQQDASARPAAMVREMPLVWTSGLPNGMRTVGFLYEYSRVDEVRIMCACHGSYLTPAEFVEHAGGGQVANPLRSILVRSPSWL